MRVINKKLPVKYVCILLLAIATLAAGCKKNKKEPTVNSSYKPESVKIWDEAPHSAFTDIIRFKNAFYCTFREAQSHITGVTNPGKVRVIKSTDGINWSSIVLFELSEKDIRDPKLSITPDNRLMVFMDVETYAANGTTVSTRTPYVSFSASGDTFSDPEETILEPAIKASGNWIWRLTWHKGIAYGVDYLGTAPLTVVKTTDGKNFQKVSRIITDGNPNEATIRFDNNDKMYVLIRREQLDKMGVLATSVPPYTTFEQKKLSIRLGGPNFIFLDDNTLCIATREFTVAGAAIGTAVFTTDLQGNIKKKISLSSNGDTSYAGMLIYDGKLWVSYYSSHQGKAQIYITKIPLSELN